jgi:predicted flap endonuclease-1-like 5' DNA nuclease
MTDITEVKGIGPATAVKLHGAGIRSAEALAKSQVDHLVGIIGRTTARKIIANAQELMKSLEGVVATEEPVETVEAVEEVATIEEVAAPEGDLTTCTSFCCRPFKCRRCGQEDCRENY